MQFFRDLWAGKINLVKAYWLFGVLPGAAFFIINTVLLLMYGPLALVLINLLVEVPYFVLWSVGTWRSAVAYRNEKSKKVFWGYLVHVIIVLSWLANLRIIFENISML